MLVYNVDYLDAENNVIKKGILMLPLGIFFRELAGRESVSGVMNTRRGCVLTTQSYSVV